MDLTETQIGSEPIFNGTFVTIACDTVRLPNGNDSKRIVIRHPGAACVLAETPDGKIVFVELLAGKLDAGEDPAACALRELAEETPYAAEKVELAATFYTAPGFCDEKMYLYRAFNISKSSNLQPDQDEFVETVLLDRQEVLAAVRNNEIQDAKTLIGLQHWLLAEAV